MSGELWLAEGFTNYYESLILMRAGLMHLDDFAGNAGGHDQHRQLRPGPADSHAPWR